MASFGFSSVEPSGSDNSNRDLHYIVIYSNDNVFICFYRLGILTPSLSSYEASISLNTSEDCGRRSSKHPHILSETPIQ
jgi:hypothetical protein